MPDREKVLKALRCLSNPFDEERDCDNCSYDFCSCVLDATADALELLKAYELVKPVFVGNDEWQCPECETVVGWNELDCSGIAETKYKYCPGCGRAVKWDD